MSHETIEASDFNQDRSEIKKTQIFKTILFFIVLFVYLFIYFFNNTYMFIGSSSCPFQNVYYFYESRLIHLVFQLHFVGFQGPKENRTSSSLH